MAASKVSTEFIGEITALKKQQNADEALRTLQKIAAHVAPIMKKRSWFVGKLQEFFPSNRNLLGMNVNRGAKIFVRLRPAHDEKSFYPYHHVLGTMLHELVHMKIGPHNDAFYKFLDELWEEADMISDGKMLPATPFSGAGHKLGGRNPMSARTAAAEAAERRRKKQMWGGASGVRLGGDEGTNKQAKRKLTPQELRRRALEAAERRLRDNEECRAVLDGHSVTIDGVEEESRVEPEDIKPTVLVRSLSISNKAKTTAGTAPNAVPTREKEPEIVIIDDEVDNEKEKIVERIEDSEEVTLVEVVVPRSPLSTWSCPECTLINSSKREDCEACGFSQRTGKPGDEVEVISSKLHTAASSSSLGPSSNAPSSRDRKRPAPVEETLEDEAWTCDACTSVNSLSNLTCEACGNARLRVARLPLNGASRDDEASSSSFNPFQALTSSSHHAWRGSKPL